MCEDHFSSGFLDIIKCLNFPNDISLCKNKTKQINNLKIQNNTVIFSEAALLYRSTPKVTKMSIVSRTRSHNHNSKRTLSISFSLDGDNENENGQSKQTYNHKRSKHSVSFQSRLEKIWKIFQDCHYDPVTTYDKLCHHIDYDISVFRDNVQSIVSKCYEHDSVWTLLYAYATKICETNNVNFMYDCFKDLFNFITPFRGSYFHQHRIKSVHVMLSFFLENHRVKNSLSIMFAFMIKHNQILDVFEEQDQGRLVIHSDILNRTDLSRFECKELEKTILWISKLQYNPVSKTNLVNLVPLMKLYNVQIERSQNVIREVMENFILCTINHHDENKNLYNFVRIIRDMLCSFFHDIIGHERNILIKNIGNMLTESLEVHVSHIENLQQSYDNYLQPDKHIQSLCGIYIDKISSMEMMHVMKYIPWSSIRSKMMIIKKRMIKLFQMLSSNTLKVIKNYNDLQTQISRVGFYMKVRKPGIIFDSPVSLIIQTVALFDNLNRFSNENTSLITKSLHQEDIQLLVDYLDIKSMSIGSLSNLAFPNMTGFNSISQLDYGFWGDEDFGMLPEYTFEKVPRDKNKVLQFCIANKQIFEHSQEWYIKFKDEEGIGISVVREFLSILAEAIFTSPDSPFILDDECGEAYILKENPNIEILQIFVMCLREYFLRRITFPYRFPICLLIPYYNWSSDFAINCLETMQPIFAKSCLDIMNADRNTLSKMALFFEDANNHGNRVTLKNREMYIKQIIKNKIRFHDDVSLYLGTASSFINVVKNLWSFETITDVIFSPLTFPLMEWKAQFDPCDIRENKQMWDWFWDFMKTVATKEQVRKFYRFCTGFSSFQRFTQGSSSFFHFKSYGEHVTGGYIQVSACDSTIRLPNYPTYDKFKESLLFLLEGIDKDILFEFSRQ